MENLRIVLLGKTGAGKSSLAETMFGEKVFEIHHTANSGTDQCMRATREVHGRNITMIDTPGFFDTCGSEGHMRPNIARCITECSPGPHAFLILLKVERYTEQENEVISKITQCFSEEAFRYAVVVFTHGDQLQEGMQIEEFVSQNESLRDLLERCGGRCHVIDNKYWKNNQQDEYRNNQQQVENLLNTITEIVNQNKGGFYTNEMLQAVSSAILVEAQHIQASSSQMSRQNILILAKNKVLHFLKTAAGITTGVLLGALLGVPVMVVKVVTALMNMETDEKVAAAVAGATGAAQSGVGYTALGAAAGAGAIVGGFIGYSEAVEADSIWEAVANTGRAVSDLAEEQMRKMWSSTQSK